MGYLARMIAVSSVISVARAVSSTVIWSALRQFAARHQFPGYRGDSLGPIYVTGRGSTGRRSHPWKGE